MKINEVTIEGLRGVRYKMEIPLGAKSALLYGDNGSGKSSISDVFEWFYFDKVAHLSDEEIGRSGIEAMRNVFLAESQLGKLSLSFTSKEHNALKVLEQKGDKLKSQNSNDNEAFKEYLHHSCSENLILRYRDLVNFVLASKTTRLKALSDIIGYSEVTATRDTFRTVKNSLAKEIRNKTFDNQINHQQAQIIEQLQQNITSDAQFINAVAKLIEPFKLEDKINKLEDIDPIMLKIKKPDDSKEVAQENFLVKIDEKMVVFPANLDELEADYKHYKAKYDQVVSDLEKLKKLSLEKLLSTGKSILEDKAYFENNCPLCLTEQAKDKLLSAVGVRLSELQEIKNEQAALAKQKDELDRQLKDASRVLTALTIDKQLDETQNNKLKDGLLEFQSQLKRYDDALKRKVEDGELLEKSESLIIERADVTDLCDLAKSMLTELRSQRKADPKWDAYSKINISKHAYAAIKRLKKEQEVYELQLATMEAIYTSFQKCQKDALETFLQNFSGRINDVYVFLNPGEKVENIKLVPIEKDEELLGITIQFDFLHTKDVSPPHKFLSESHLNCVGLGFFLASVEAFNKKNKFLILDDVISSFDVNHRKRFADLLVEQYSDYQIILLTHEKSWFDMVNNLVRGKGWFVNTIKHDLEKGTHLDEPPQSLRERIEAKIQGKIEDNLGNDSRKYLEHILKEIAASLQVKVAFRFNDQNEDRMAYDLLLELKGTINSRKCTELQAAPVIERLIKSTFIGNKDSHDSSFVPKFQDMKAFWDDVTEFEKLFLCPSCKSLVSAKHYDSVGQKIRCKDGAHAYTWKL